MKELKSLRAIAAALIAGFVTFACNGSAHAAMTHAAAIVDTRAAVQKGADAVQLWKGRSVRLVRDAK